MRTLVALLATAVASTICRADFQPDTYSPVFDGTSGVIVADVTPYLAGSQIVLTNCAVLAHGQIGTNVSAVALDLTGCGLSLSVGNALTSHTYAATIQVATAGTFCATVALPPAQAPLGMQSGNFAGIILTVTNGAQSRTYRDEKRLPLRTPFH